jgi:hypothetical protein
LGIQRIDRKRKSTKEDHWEEEPLATKLNAMSGVGRPLLKRIRGWFYEVKPEDKEL